MQSLARPASLTNRSTMALRHLSVAGLPCSATGIKLLRNKKDIDKLCAVQRVLTHKAFDLLSTGAEPPYSTCSILRQGNDRFIAEFVREQEAA